MLSDPIMFLVSFVPVLTVTITLLNNKVLTFQTEKGAQMAALAEGIKLAQNSQLDTSALHDILCKGAMASPLVQVIFVN